MKTKRLKRLCAFLLATATGFSAMQAVLPPVEAADSYYVKFVDKISKEQDFFADLLEGESINTVKVTPPNYNYADPAFVQTRGDNEPVAPNGFITTSKVGDTIEITAGTGPTITGATSTLYNIRPSFNAMLTRSSTGYVSYTIPVTDDTGTHNVSKKLGLSAQVTTSGGLSVKDEGTIVFKSQSAQTSNGQIAEFSLVTSATGGLAEFKGAQVTCDNNQTKNKGQLFIQISKLGSSSSGASSTTEQAKTIELRLDTASDETADLFPANTEFSLTFRQETINDLQLTIVSRQFAVNEIAKDIKRNFDGDERSYVKFQGNDNANSVSRDFNLQKLVQEYNFKEGFRVEWTWEQDRNDIPTCIAIRDKDPGGSTVTAEIINHPLENVQGRLIAKVKFVKEGENTVESTEIVKIAITIRGTGVMPEVRATSKITGFFNTVTQQREDRAESLTYDNFPDVMDIYDGGIMDWAPPVNPYRFTGTLSFGEGLSAASNIVISAGDNDKGQADIYLGNNLTTKYVPGTQIKNMNDNGAEYHLPFQVRAVKAGMVTLTVTFLNSAGESFGVPKRIHINVIDTSPSSDASMSDIAMKGIMDETAEQALKDRFHKVFPTGVIPYGFSKDVYDYEGANAITVPSMVKAVTLKPTYFYKSATGKNGPVSISWTEDGLVKNAVLGISNGILEESPEIPLILNVPQTVTLYGCAEDGTKVPVYTLVITRKASENSSLQGLSLITKDNVERITDFDPMKTQYEVHLDYSYRGKGTTLKATAADQWAKSIEIKGEPLETGFFEELRQLLFSNTAKLDLKYSKDNDTGVVDNVNVVNVVVTSEAGTPGTEITYTVTVFIDDPSENNQLSQLEVYRSDTDSKEQIFFDNKQVFDKNGRDFYLTIPYSTEKLRFVMLPDDEKAQKVRYGLAGAKLKEVDYKKKGTPLEATVDVKASDPIKDKEKAYQFEFAVQAESDEWTEVSYLLHITRADPDIDARLASMTVVDEATGTAVETFAFNPQKTDYTFEVPYNTTSVVVSPVAQSKLSKVTVNDAKISEQFPGKSVTLKAGTATTVTVRVVPEGGKDYAQDYVLHITRQTPSNEARLLNMTVAGAENMQPQKFQPSHTSYSVDVPENTQSFTVTPTPVDPNATITVDGKPVAAGTASGPIVTTKGNQTIKVVVTAEDGKTTKTYNLNVRNYNYITKSNDATLSSLYVNYGDLAPRFRSNIEEYELYVKPEAMSLELKPQRSNSRATMKVYGDSRQLAEYDGTYSASLLSDKTEFSIDVTAEDGTQKTYVINVYRNDKKKQGALKPITSDMVNYLEDPIVIDITNYAVIDASVFNTLKTDYPDKTMLFQGNDYSLQIKGSDISGLVPHTNTYDLFFSFTTPDESLIQQAIWDIDSDSAQDLEELEPVYLHFDDHGALPGKMLLTVNLGREYSNDQLFWNYFNAERERIDYYGYVRSNAKGGFTVPITHLSTYFITKEKIVGAENKVNVSYGGVAAGSGTSDLDTNVGQGDAIGGKETEGKTNPQTGVDIH